MNHTFLWTLLKLPLSLLMEVRMHKDNKQPARFAEVSMLSKCANPTCCASFRRLTEGKLFQVETCYSSNPPETDNGNGKRTMQRRTEYFWLCSDCCRGFTLVSANGRVTTVPLPEETTLRTLEIQRKPALSVSSMGVLSAAPSGRYGT